MDAAADVEAVLLQRGKVVHVGVELVVVVVDGEAELDEAYKGWISAAKELRVARRRNETVDARRERRRLVEAEAGREQRRVVEEPDEVLDRLVALVGLLRRDGGVENDPRRAFGASERFARL